MENNNELPVKLMLKNHTDAVDKAIIKEVKDWASIDNRHAKMQITFTGKLLNYANYRQYSDVFLETGTATGDGVQRALDAGFKPVHTCEQWMEYFDASCKRFIGCPVYLYPGKSVDALPQMLYQAAQKAVIFLDAHPAGPGSAGHDEWVLNPNGEANQHNIICAELAIILRHRNDHVIIIDDVNGMDDGCAAEYMRLCLLVNAGYKFEFWDEDLSGSHRYINKILVCLP